MVMSVISCDHDNNQSTPAATDAAHWQAAPHLWSALRPESLTHCVFSSAVWAKSCNTARSLRLRSGLVRGPWARLTRVTLSSSPHYCKLVPHSCGAQFHLIHIHLLFSLPPLRYYTYIDTSARIEQALPPSPLCVSCDPSPSA